MASTLDHAQHLDHTQAGERRHLKSEMDVDLRPIYVKFNLVCEYVKRNRPCTVQSVRGLLNRLLTSVFLKRSGVKRTIVREFCFWRIPYYFCCTIPATVGRKVQVECLAYLYSLERKCFQVYIYTRKTICQFLFLVTF